MTDFILTSCINNKNKKVTQMHYKALGFRCIKEKDGIIFWDIQTNHKIKVPFDNIKAFGMAIFESYSQFSDEFIDKIIKIFIKVESKNQKS